ncbi:Alpha/Beta hydrolase fold [Phytophthora cactorum]|nr:Alpha/Beta hydrolase fold [Phytophthora cactorum]
MHQRADRVLFVECTTPTLEFIPKSSTSTTVAFTPLDDEALRDPAASLVVTAATLVLASAIEFNSGLSAKTTSAATKTSTTEQTSVEQTSPDTAVSLAPVAPVAACSDLLAVDLTAIGGSGSNITAAEESDSDGSPTARLLVMLPVANWTQRYMQVGCGGLCGNINIQPGAADGSAQVSNGEFAMASTDMAGGSDGEFGLDEDRRVAFAYLAVHQTAETAKKLIKAYYGQDAAYSYFNGCSDGGREAVMEAIRYPNDFDGIIAVSNTDDEGNRVVIAERASILHDAVVKACDSLDGIEDGLLSDPRLCNFDPSTIECAADATDNSTCLTSAEVTAVTKFYNGPKDSGKYLTLAWSGVFVSDSYTGNIMSTNTALAAIKYLIFEDYPGDNYTLSDFDFAKSTVDLLRARHPLLDAVSSDLSKFHKAGGKLIIWHGWSDPHISPHEHGQKVLNEFERLYLLPGVYHCGSGEGPSAIDLVTPMLEWVEAGTAPDAIDTSTPTNTGESKFGQWAKSGSGAGGPPSGSAPQRNLESEASSSASGSAATTVTRPVYPYPAVAKYKGTGDVNDAANFEKGSALYTKPTRSWLGEDFFKPYTPTKA